MRMSEVAPVDERRRIKSLDVVRGFALLGILAVNAAYFAAPMQAAQNPTAPPLAVTDETLWTWFTMHVFFEFKMITLFSMLFGASIFMIGGERSDKERGAVLRRRLGWLLLIGAIHGALIWYGDILFVYAITGFLVLFARSWRPVTLTIWGVILFLLSLGVMAGLGAMMSMAPGEALEDLRTQMWAPPAEEIARMIGAYQGGLVSATAENFRLWTEFLWFMPVMILRTAGVMLFGMALFKWGFFSGNARAWVYAIVAGLGAIALWLVAYQAHINAEAGFDFLHMMSAGQTTNMALSPFISLLYASVLILAVKWGVVRMFTNALAAVGRMAFTNYLTQSIIMTTIFYGGRGLGLYGEIDRIGLWQIVLAVWALQLVWSPLWLSKFRMGPFEWAWRRVSYARPIAIAKT
jgi:uncharacterized protein